MDYYEYKLWSTPPPMKDISKDTLTTYIKREVIPLFEKQRKRSQFAAIILCSREDCDSELLQINYSPLNVLGEPQTNSSCPFMPQRDFDNYITARPDRRGHHHAEKLLISQLDDLYTSFRSKHGTPCYVILYTWITPCSNCATLIINKLSERPYSDIPRVVAHTTNTSKGNDDVRAAKARLREAGIEVLEVPHQKLPIRQAQQQQFSSF